MSWTCLLYTAAFVRGIEYTLLLAVVSVLLAILPALGLALMRLSRKKPVRWLSGAYIAVFRSTPMLVKLSIIYYGLFYAISLPRIDVYKRQVLNTQVISATSSTSSSPTVRSFPDDSCPCSAPSANPAAMRLIEKTPWQLNAT